MHKKILLDEKTIYKVLSFFIIIVFMFHLSSLEKMMPQKALGDISQKLQEILPESTAPILENLEDEGNGNFNSNLEKETPPPENEGIPSVEEDESPLQEKKQTQSSKEMDTEIKQENGESEDSEEGITPDCGPENDGELQIVTDLHNKEITYDELENDVLSFYAYLLNGEGKTLKVKLQNSLTPQNGNYLVGSEKDYQAVLGRNEVNLITLYVKDGKETIQEVTYAISYVAKKADEKNPTVGEKPPTIITNLENVKQLNNRNFTLNVQAIAYVIESNSLNDKKIVLEIRLMENSDSYEQYQTFTMDIQRTPSLEALTVSGDGTVLKLDFDKKVKEYTVSTTADSVAVTATALSNEAEIMIAGQVAENGVSHAIELTDAIKLEDGRYTIPVTVTAQNGQTASYVLYVVKMEAIQVVLNSPNLDASVEVFNDAGAKVEPISEEGTRYTYHVVLDTEYTYIVTENDFYHATAKFKVEGPQTINLPSPKTEEHWLNTLSLKAGNDTNKNAPVYELTPGFDTATHNYSAIFESNTAAFYLKAFANKLLIQNTIRSINS